MLMPIRGHEKVPLVTLEEAVAPLVSILPEIQDYAYVAKQRVESIPADGLTQDESASVILYSMEWKPHGECLYFALNTTLRAEDRRKLEPWFPYLRLFLSGLARIPSKRHFVYRGVKKNLSKQYPEGKTFVWWAFSSCTSSIKVLENEQFLGKTGERTMFTIDCESGKDISRHSYYQSEEEILLLAARQFVVKSCLEPALGLHMIQLKETESPVSLLRIITSEPNLIQSSTVILEETIDNKFEDSNRPIRLQIISQKLTPDLQEKFQQIKSFFMLMDPIIPLSKSKIKYRSEIKLNPMYNCIYAKRHVFWSGAHNDGNSYGPKPYYCPVGWQRWSFYVTDDFHEKFKGWCICYHGAKFAYGLSILLSGLKTENSGSNDSIIYVTPSINYAAHPRFAEIKLIPKWFKEKFFKSGQYIQFVLECRVHPNSIKRICAETMGASTTAIDLNISNEILEWVIVNRDKDIANFSDPNSPIICTGILIRVTDEHPGLLPESSWWYEAHVCDRQQCCALGTDLKPLQKQKNRGVKCNILFD